MKINDIIIDKDGSEVLVMDITSNSVRLFIKAKSDEGVNSSDWHLIDKEFDKRFNLKK